MLNVLSVAVDTAMCGRVPDEKVALTALGFAVQIVFLMLVAMLGLMVGTVGLVARAHGANQRDRVNHVLNQSSILTVLLSVVVAVIGNLVAGPVMSALGASPEVRDAGLEYLRPIFAGSVFYYLLILYGSVLRGVGNTRVAFLIALVTNGLNVLLNYLLILGNLGFPALGIQGAAIGTILSQAIGVVIYIFLLRSGSLERLKLSLWPRRFDKKLIAELWMIGAPAALDMIIFNVGFLLLIGMIGRMEEVAVAAHGIGLRVQALAFIPGLSVSQATSAMVGQALGGGRIEEARQVLRASIVLCVAIMSSLAVILVLAAQPIVGLFDVQGGTPLSSYSIEWIRILALGMPIVGVHIAFVGLLQGAGATGISLRINAFATVFIQIPLGALLGFTAGLGPAGVWLSFPASFAIRVAFEQVVYKRNRWAKTGARLGPVASAEG